MAIFQNVFALVPVSIAEAEDAFAGVQYTGPAGSGAETVDEPRELLEWSEFENLHALRCAD